MFDPSKVAQPSVRQNANFLGNAYNHRYYGETKCPHCALIFNRRSANQITCGKDACRLKQIGKNKSDAKERKVAKERKAKEAV